MEGIYAQADQIKVYKAILDAAQELATHLRFHSAHQVKTVNPFGKQQTDLDLIADQIVFNHLKKSGVVYAAMSEERPFVNELNTDGTFTVTFDPIDGSNVLDVNMSVASLFGIWKTKDINGSTGRDLVGAACAVYGPRTSIILYNCQTNKVEELTLMRSHTKTSWVVTKPHLQIAANKAKLFSPGLRSCYDVPELLEVFNQYCKEGYSLRHSGCMALDCYQIFLKGQGVYSKFDSVAHPTNLRLIYEILPMGFLIEHAGGKTDDGTGKSVLDTVIKGYAQQVSFIAGNQYEVEHLLSKVKGSLGAGGLVNPVGKEDQRALGKMHQHEETKSQSEA